VNEIAHNFISSGSQRSASNARTRITCGLYIAVRHECISTKPNDQKSYEVRISRGFSDQSSLRISMESAVAKKVLQARMRVVKKKSRKIYRWFPLERCLSE
jgi:hypothetical protein